MVCQGDESVHVTVAMVIKACLKCPLPKISSSAPLTADLSEKGVDTHAGKQVRRRDYVNSAILFMTTHSVKLGLQI